MNEVSPSGDILDEKRVVEFRENGVLIVESFYDFARDIVPIQEDIYRVIGQVMARHDVSDRRRPFSPGSFDDGYNSLIAIDRSYGGEVYDAVKQIPAFVRLVGHPVHEQVFKTLRPGSIPGIAAGGYGIRIDNPNEERFRAPWHQEYPAQLRSIDGLAFWSPLISMSPELGPVEFCLGSHREGLVPVHTRDPKNPEKSGAYALTLKNEENLLRKYKKGSPLAKPGDLIIIDFLVLHSSGYNVSKRSRWSMQFRYFNFNEPTGMRYGWKGSFASGFDFRTVHPDLCVD
jgi:hypothetical protein